MYKLVFFLLQNLPRFIFPEDKGELCLKFPFYIPESVANKTGNARYINKCINTLNKSFNTHVYILYLFISTYLTTS